LRPLISRFKKVEGQAMSTSRFSSDRILPRANAHWLLGELLMLDSIPVVYVVDDDISVRESLEA